jgi:hypothetical protein
LACQLRPDGDALPHPSNPALRLFKEGLRALCGTPATADARGFQKSNDRGVVTGFATFALVVAKRPQFPAGQFICRWIAVLNPADGQTGAFGIEFFPAQPPIAE